MTRRTCLGFALSLAFLAGLSPEGHYASLELWCPTQDTGVFYVMLDNDTMINLITFDGRHLQDVVRYTRR